MSHRTVIFGAPGAGKGTQAQRVCSKLDMVHLSTGDLLRAAVAAASPAGLQAKAFMEAGNLVPDEVVFGVLFERLQPDSSVAEGSEIERFMLDGFPRNRAQAKELDRRLASRGKGSQGSQGSLDMVLEIRVPDERIVARITGRRICKGCGRNYHVEFVQPANEGVCDECDGELYQRSDDVESVVQERLAVYHEQTAPLVEYYTERGILLTVNGDQAPDLVTEAVLGALSGSAATSSNDVAGHRS